MFIRPVPRAVMRLSEEVAMRAITGKAVIFALAFFTGINSSKAASDDIYQACFNSAAPGMLEPSRSASWLWSTNLSSGPWRESSRLPRLNWIGEDFGPLLNSWGR